MRKFVLSTLLLLIFFTLSYAAENNRVGQEAQLKEWYWFLEKESKNTVEKGISADIKNPSAPIQTELSPTTMELLQPPSFAAAATQPSLNTASTSSPSITISVSNAAGSVGQAGIPVTVEIGPLVQLSIFSIDLWMTFDSNLLEIQEVNKDDAIPEQWSLYSNCPVPGMFKVALYDVPEVSKITHPLKFEGGSLVKIIFNVKTQSSPGAVTLHLAKANFNNQPASLIYDGVFNILNPAPSITQIAPNYGLPGDVVTINGVNFGEFNGDLNYDRQADFDKNGKIDGIDFSLFMPAWHAVSGDPNYNPLVDINSDGSIDGIDFSNIVSGLHSCAGTTRVEFPNDKWANVISWSDTEIKCRLPFGTTSGSVYVVNDKGKSNGVDCIILGK